MTVVPASAGTGADTAAGTPMLDAAMTAAAAAHRILLPFMPAPARVSWPETSTSPDPLLPLRAGGRSGRPRGGAGSEAGDHARVDDALLHLGVVLGDAVDVERELAVADGRAAVRTGDAAGPRAGRDDRDGAAYGADPRPGA